MGGINRLHICSNQEVQLLLVLTQCWTIGKSFSFNFSTIMEKWHTSVCYWRKIQGSTPFDAETSDGEWMLIMLDGKRQHMPTAKTAVHKHSVQTYMHRILYSAFWAEWNSGQQVSFTALQKFLRKMKICGICVLLPTTISSAGTILMINKSWMHSHDLQLKSKMVRGDSPPNHGSFHNTCCVVYLSTVCV